MFKKLLTLMILVVVFAGLAVVYCAQTPILPAQQSTAVEFAIKPGSALSSTARQIAQASVPLNPTLFAALVRFSGKSSRLQAGTYLLMPGETPLQLMDKLVRGEFEKTSIAIIEGWTFAQMRAAINADPDVPHDTAQLSDRQLLAEIDPKAVFPEGLFFPDTYVLAKGSSDWQVYRMAYLRMQSQLESAWTGRAAGLPYKTPYDALIMASLVEKESGCPQDQGMVAGVFVNRLNKGMLLQTDPSVIYGMGARYQGRIGRAGLETDTPYNTYLHAGLPPTPICLPGAGALAAALHPATTQALYFVASGGGSSHFSGNLEQHNAAVNRYIKKFK